MPTAEDIVRSSRATLADARARWEAGQTAAAIAKARSALEEAELGLGAEHELSIVCMAELAQYLKLTGDQLEALGLFTRARDLAEMTLGEDYPLVARMLLGMGEVYSEQKMFAEAEIYLEKALHAFESADRDHREEILDTLVALATVQIALLKTNDALKNFERARIASSGKLYQLYPRAFENVAGLARALLESGQNATALELLHDAEKIADESQGVSGILRMQILETLADAEQFQGNADAAQAVLERVYDIKCEVFGRTALDTLSTVLRLAQSALDRGDLEYAEQQCEDVMALLDGEVEVDASLERALANKILGEIYCVTHRYPEAEAQLRQAYEFYARAGEDNVQHLGDVLHNLAMLSYARGEVHAALEQMLETAAVKRRSGKISAISMAQTELSLGLFYEQSGDHARAKSQISEHIEAARLALGPEHTLVLNAQRILSGDHIPERAPTEGRVVKAEKKVAPEGSKIVEPAKALQLSINLLKTAESYLELDDVARAKEALRDALQLLKKVETQ